MKDNIILIGFMGSGKTSVGKLLAKELSYKFIDTDAAIEEKENSKISRIFEEKGEAYFRDLETNILNEMLPVLHKSILSTGGGMPLRDCNMNILKELGLVVYLKATKETTVLRVRGDSNRPILAGNNLDDRVERLLKERAPFYELAHIMVTTDNKSYEEIILEILEQYYLIYNRETNKLMKGDKYEDISN